MKKPLQSKVTREKLIYFISELIGTVEIVLKRAGSASEGYPEKLSKYYCLEFKNTMKS